MYKPKNPRAMQIRQLDPDTIEVISAVKHPGGHRMTIPLDQVSPKELDETLEKGEKSAQAWLDKNLATPLPLTEDE